MLTAHSVETPLPDYERPPVIEVVCGIQFEPIPKFQATTFGLFWQTIRDEYIQAQEMGSLSRVIEQIPSVANIIPPRVEILDTPPLPRIFFVNKIPSWLIQLQRDRFLHNWRKEKDEDIYPRYPVVIDKFWKGWEKFSKFCKDEDLGEIIVNQLEITYINHIPIGQGWKTLGDLGKVFPDVSWRCEERFLPFPESIGLRLSFILPESQGRLHVSLKHAIRVADNQSVLLCELTARGMSASKDSSAIRAWFDLGRQWIVRGFADIIDKKIQKELWGRKV
jgi:uncharacterized protein (TIGR04255 family)